MIKSFRGENAFLSNFYFCFVFFEGIRYPSVEHAFQAAKTLDENERKRFAVMQTAADAKYFGRRVKLREDWEQVKDEVMLECLRSKFQNKELKEKLIATQSKLLVEGNNHGDRYWGKVNGEGRNKLGELLMKVRSELNANT